MGVLKGLFSDMIKLFPDIRRFRQVSFVSEPSKKTQIKDNFEKERNRLAELCKMGDAIAMYDMAHLFLSRCTDEQKEIVNKYEVCQNEESQAEFEAYMERHKCDVWNMEAYMTWIVRAAMYGNKIAKELTGKCGCYKEMAYIPYRFYLTDGEPELFWSSESFYKMGFCDICRNKKDCGIIFYKKQRYFEFYYVSYYEPPDEYGFGSETEYESVYFDEFFRRVPVRVNASKEEILCGLKKTEAEREKYWALHNNSIERKYTRQ